MLRPDGSGENAPARALFILAVFATFDNILRQAMRTQKLNSQSGTQSPEIFSLAHFRLFFWYKNSKRQRISPCLYA